MDSIEEINKASRSEVVSYLESWGFQCYDHESTQDLREEAVRNFETEGAGDGPIDVPAPR